MRDFGVDSNSGLLENPLTREPYVAQLTEIEKNIVDHVWRRYSAMSGTQLSAMTHLSGTPWTATYFGSGRNAEIPNDQIQQHYKELALAGRERKRA